MTEPASDFEEEAIFVETAPTNSEPMVVTTPLLSEDLSREEINTLAWGVLRGEIGVGQKRRDALGKDYYQVMREVQRIRMLSSQR